MKVVIQKTTKRIMPETTSQLLSAKKESLCRSGDQLKDPEMNKRKLRRSQVHNCRGKQGRAPGEADLLECIAVLRYFSNVLRYFGTIQLQLYIYSGLTESFKEGLFCEKAVKYLCT